MIALRWNSLRWRLPLLMAAVIIVVVGTFLGLAFREVQSSLLMAAGARAHGAADQLASLLAQSTQQRLLEIRTVASDGSVRDYLQHPTDDAKRMAQARLSKLTSPSPQILELWNRSHERAISLAASHRHESAAAGHVGAHDERHQQTADLPGVTLHGDGDGGGFQQSHGCVRAALGLSGRSASGAGFRHR